MEKYTTIPEFLYSGSFVHTKIKENAKLEENYIQKYKKM